MSGQLDPLTAALLVAAFFAVPPALLAVYALLGGQFGERAPPQKARNGARGFWAIFMLIWSAAILFLDVGLFSAIVKQYQALSFTQVEGEVLGIRAREVSDGEGISFKVDIEYAYRVEDRDYRSSRIRHLKSWGKRSAADFVAAHPPQSRLIVHYNPDDPADAVLMPGLNGGELFLLLFLLPFNLIMLGLWGGSIAYLWRGQTNFSEVPCRIIEESERTRVRLPHAWPAAAVLLVLTFGTIPVVLVVGCCAGTSPSIEVMVITWSVVLGSAALVYVLMTRQIASGKHDLIIGRLQKTLTLPATYGRAKPVVVAVADLLAVEVASEPNKNSEDNGVRYLVTLRWRDRGGLQEGKLTEWSDEKPAQQFAAWLRAKLGLTAPNDLTGAAFLRQPGESAP